MGLLQAMCVPAEAQDIDKTTLLNGADNGRIKDDYELGRLLAEGRTGKVFLANRRHRTAQNSNMKVAMKRIANRTKVNRAAFKQEVAALKYLGIHPNIVQLEETRECSDFLYILTAFGAGGDLFDHVVDGGQISEAQTAAWMYQTLDALAFCHARNVVHRDIKPENLVFTSKDESAPIVLIDFGCSLQVREDAVYADIGGTVYYSAPEVTPAFIKKNGAPTGATLKKADVWAVGVMAYWIMTQCVPFFGKTDEEICRQIVNDKLVFPPNPKTSNAFKHFVAQLLAKDASRRVSAEEALKHPWFRTFGLGVASDTIDAEDDAEEENY